MLSGERSMHVDTSPLHHSTTPPFGPLAADRKRARWRRGGLDALQPHWPDWWWAGVPVVCRDYHPHPHPHLPPSPAPPFSHPHPHPHPHKSHSPPLPPPSTSTFAATTTTTTTTHHRSYIHTSMASTRPAPGFESQGMSHRPPLAPLTRASVLRNKERAHLRPLCPTRKGAVEGAFVASGS